jgi:hypothetical protein
VEQQTLMELLRTLWLALSGALQTPLVAEQQTLMELLPTP